MSVRISVESLSGCAWNGCPSQRGIRSFEICDAREHQLRGAVASLSTIIYQHDRAKTPSHTPVSQRVDTIIKSIIDARPQRIHLLESDFAALLCGIELEEQYHRSAQHETPSP